MSITVRLLFLLLVIGNVGFFIANGVVDEYQRDDFPAEFVFGSGTSAYQVEGAVLEDGRSFSIWDTFAHSGYYNGANGDVACDGYHKYKEDIQLMADTGLEAFRFSISWSRLIPNGSGSVNAKGLQYYNNFINELLSHGIQPHVTLFHDDLPQILEDEYGGWISRKAVKDYLAYVDICFREFGDRILHWTTFNEANVFSLGGYDVGFTPPGRCSSPFGFGNCTNGGNSSYEPYLVTHHLLLAHASAVRLYRKKYKGRQHGFVGINVFAYWFEPYTNTMEDLKATQRAHDFYLGWFLNPLVNGDYPETVKKNAGNRIPSFTKLESERIKGSFDFFGINHYTTLQVKDNPSSLENDIRDFMADMAVTLIFSGTEIPPTQFLVEPLGLQNLLNYLKEEYGNPPIYIHENGQVQPRNGTLIDTPRVEYLRAYTGALLDALRNGSNTRGYFVWSFLDLFELMDGYKSGYGLYYVDLNDKELTRYPKLSAHWYTSFLKGQNISQDDIFLKLDAKDSSSSSH
ncbi:beta-glucosidase 11-like isoform X2 [Cynara cardunculus var. scolymus]|uniref:beta-glucosidase 11-like isoform X2 n=1 Tax=Cynara cardunculus var. scolymus TaxID=59895 RepID=UPI000D63076A|nr:beta-glucosidase 11-like isoform X2 [Cynara cardunculus var. scolymus]